MSYTPTGFTPEQEEELLQLRRREMELREKDYADKGKGKVWDNLKIFVSVGVPLITFFGLKEAFAAKKRRKR
jgi:hypothetical protein